MEDIEFEKLVVLLEGQNDIEIISKIYLFNEIKCHFLLKKFFYLNKRSYICSVINL
jgi:hypothetical protein